MNENVFVPLTRDECDLLAFVIDDYLNNFNSCNEQDTKTLDRWFDEFDILSDNFDWEDDEIQQTKKKVEKVEDNVVFVNFKVRKAANG